MAAYTKHLFQIFTFGTALALAQSKHPPNLARYTQAQLIACDDDLKSCGATSIYEIDDEFRRRLPKLPDATLVQCFSDWKICGLVDDDTYGWPVSGVLARRGHLTELIARYGDTPDVDTRAGLEHVAYYSKAPEARGFMKQAFAKQLDDGENLYWPAKYLSKQCDPTALHYLSHTVFSISSLELASSTELFGKCHYRPAIPFLVSYALQAASLNLVSAADESLRAIYPNSPKFSSLEDEQHWFCRLAHHNGYKADCEERDASNHADSPSH